MEIPKTYSPKEWEEKLYALWQESGFFNPDNLPGNREKTFSIIMPPPNANGRLHAGHGLDMTLKDILVRYKRMAGYKALLVPGADHAGFETQIVYERKLESDGRSRFDMEPEELYQNILEFTLENKKYMESDIRRLGTSCDWSRELFTLDPRVIQQVHETFKKMFDDGLVYRGSRIVNWCSKHQTSLSEVETEYIEKKDPFYYFQYGPFVIGTARPETKFGDKYVVMHPEDERYSEYKDGDKLTVEWINGPIEATIVKDKSVDREFGTGVMTITPWHDPIDFEIAERHNLEKEQIIDFEGKLLPIAGEFAGLPITEAREKIVEKLKEKGLLVKIDDDYQHSVKVCYKCGTTIEPQIKSQWFVKMKPLAEMAIEPVQDGRIQFLPKRFEKIFFHWMNNTIDWNISRQIVWGIPIPAKICTACDEGFPDLEDTLTECPDCKGTLIKDTDTFDTWFSSGQWPLLTLQYPDGKDFKEYYPTDLMETGADLVFKWVPRMIMFGMYLTKKEPFKTVYFHGMVNDEKNQKMSKSKGNVISPIELSDQFGTDAMRMALITGNGPGNNIPLSFPKVEAFRNFANKLWNMSRYVAQSKDKENESQILEAKTLADRFILSRLGEVTEEVTRFLENYQISLASETLKDFTWNEFADWYIEIHKIEKNDAVLEHVFETLLRLWHPFMPFVTEAIFQTRNNKEELLMIAEWPKKEASHENTKDVQRFRALIGLISEIRSVRALYRIEPKTELDLSIRTGTELIEENAELVKRLARIKSLGEEKETLKGSALVQHELLSALLHLEGVIDIQKEQSRLEEEKKNLETYKKGIEGRLSDPNFTKRAPEHIIKQNESTLEETKKKIDELERSLSHLVA